MCAYQTVSLLCRSRRKSGRSSMIEGVREQVVSIVLSRTQSRRLISSPQYFFPSILLSHPFSLSLPTYTPLKLGITFSTYSLMPLSTLFGVRC
jgi:hypothetical protein